MGKSSGTAPSPDYVGAAQEQGQQNIAAAQTGAELNRVNTNTPYGDLTYSQPNKNDPNSWQADVTLSPDQQQLLNYQNSGAIGKAAAGNSMLGAATSATASPFNTSGLSPMVQQVGAPTLSQYNGNPNTSQNLDASGVPAINTDWGAQAQQAQDAAYKQQTSMLDPQYAQQSDALAARLAASGITAGSQAYSDANTDFNNQKATDYGNARNAAVGIGNSEQATLAGESLAGNNQLYGQALSTGNFNNTSAQNNFGNGLALDNANNTTEANQYGLNTSSANFQNQARASGLNEQELLRELPLNEYNALMSGTQVTQPNFNVGTAQVGSPAAGNYQSAVAQQGQNALSIYNQGIATNNANTGAAAGLGAAALLAFA